MRTTTPTPEEMERYIARFEDLPANKDRTAGKIPPEAREMMTARATRTVIATVDKDTPGRRRHPRTAEFRRGHRRM